LVYLALLGILWWSQEKLIFLPSTLSPEHRFAVPSDVHEVYIDVPGARLNALHLRQTKARGVVFFLHGNAGHLGTWFGNTALYRELGLDLFMIDYRGYGKSSGRIESEAQLHADVAAAWQLIAPRYAGRPVIFFGRSLGTGLAIRLAADLPAAERPRALVLVSPYRSLAALATEHYPFVPHAFLRYPMRSDEALARLNPAHTQITLVHGTADTLIEDHHSASLARVQPAANWVRIEGGGHNDLQEIPSYRAALRYAFEAALDNSRGTPPAR
jgi:alpha-beta hydrolase superfamily lysophospholipase